MDLEQLFLQQTLQQCNPAFYALEGLPNQEYEVLAAVFEDLLIAREGSIAVE